jgi:deoxyribonuclease-4
MALLGAHVPVAGGVQNGFPNGQKSGCDALQIFVKNANRWQGKALTETVITTYHKAREAAGHPPVVAHASYLINLCATNPETLHKSRAALKDELERCTLLGIPGLVLHPGAHMGAGREAGIAGVIQSLDVVFAELEGTTPQVWLENTAGQGTVLGSELADLAEIIAGSAFAERLGVCLDTCHAFAAGYDLRSETGVDTLLADAEASFGLSRLGCFHLNDSRHGCGAHRDRHANLGEGEIGLEAFVQLARDPRFESLPMLLETPTGEDDLGHARDLSRLREALGT